MLAVPVDQAVAVARRILITFLTVTGKVTLPMLKVLAVQELPDKATEVLTVK
jgi:hypothetical protein